MSEDKNPWGFCETPEAKCIMNYCDENGCQNRKRTYAPLKSESEDISARESLILESDELWHERMISLAESEINKIENNIHSTNQENETIKCLSEITKYIQGIGKGEVYLSIPGELSKRIEEILSPPAQKPQ